MKIFHVIGGPLDGGAAKGALLLHHGLEKEGVKSVVFTNRFSKKSSNSCSQTLSKYRSKIINKLNQFITRSLSLSYANSEYHSWYFGMDFTKCSHYLDCDIVHFHWAIGCVNPTILAQVNKPIIWTLRDMWPITGGCHYAMDCAGYKVACRICPLLKSNLVPQALIQQKSKLKLAIQKNIGFVPVSTWMENHLRASLFWNQKISGPIPNSYDPDCFCYVPKHLARMGLKLQLDQKYILIGAQDMLAPYKGGDLLTEILSFLDGNKYILIVVGSLPTELPSFNLSQIINFGFVDDEKKLNLIYAAADLFLFPSRMDAFAKMPIESMASGTPVVAFDCTGVVDAITEGLTGYLIPSFETGLFAKKVTDLLATDFAEDVYRECSIEVNRKFSNPVVVRKYIKLYESICNKNRKKV